MEFYYSSLPEHGINPRQQRIEPGEMCWKWLGIQNNSSETFCLILNFVCILTELIYIFFFFPGCVRSAFHQTREDSSSLKSSPAETLPSLVLAAANNQQLESQSISLK